MSNKEYENIIKNGQRIDWYGTEVPEELITPTVKVVAEQVIDQINKYESEGSRIKKEYIENLWINVKNLPYTLNGDFYLIKKKEIEDSLKTKKVSRKTKPKDESRVTKNSGLIFGNKK